MRPLATLPRPWLPIVCAGLMRNLVTEYHQARKTGRNTTSGAQTRSGGDMRSTRPVEPVYGATIWVRTVRQSG